WRIGLRNVSPHEQARPPSQGDAILIAEPLTLRIVRAGHSVRNIHRARGVCLVESSQHPARVPETPTRATYLFNATLGRGSRWRMRRCGALPRARKLFVLNCILRRQSGTLASRGRCLPPYFQREEIMKRALIAGLSILAIIVGVEAANAQANINPNIY